MFEIGNSLRDARVRQGLELSDLEARTNIRAKYLRAIEDEQFHVLPGETYVRGFLRLYAEKLGLDGQIYVDEYNSRFGHSEEPTPSARPRRRASENRIERHAVLIALAGIVGVTVLVIAAWRFGTGTGSETPTPAPRTDATTVVEGPPVTLVIAATTGPTYVSVRRRGGTGALVWEGTVQRGKPQRFTGDRLWVEIANPQRVRLTVDGRLADPIFAHGPVSVLVSSAGVDPQPS
jgi:transcriptional regulator with XRE-family HTH domain